MTLNHIQYTIKTLVLQFAESQTRSGNILTSITNTSLQFPIFKLFKIDSQVGIVSGTIKNTPREKAFEAYNEIWDHKRELQNWSSSSWWFFLLLPKQETGYGPKQMMFTYASRAGDLIKVSDTWQPGFEAGKKPIPIDKFMTTVVGWINDGEHVHDEIVHQPALAKLYRDKKLSAWSKQNDDGEVYGATIKKSQTKEMGIDAYFKGSKGHAKFVVWSDPDNEFTNPQISDFRGPRSGGMGGTHLVAWRKLNFRGEFKSPCGTEELEGIGYFQRVCMNVPMFPWKWTWIMFEDESMFSSFIPYLGLQAFRRSDEFYHPKLENFTKSIIPVAYFNYGDKRKPIYFDEARTIPLSKNGKISRKNPRLYVEARADNGDYIKMIIQAHGHTQFLLDRRVIMKFWQTMYNYNEFMVKVEKITGRINGKNLEKKRIGQGWGNLEYTWGLSL